MEGFKKRAIRDLDCPDAGRGCYSCVDYITCSICGCGLCKCVSIELDPPDGNETACPPCRESLAGTFPFGKSTEGAAFSSQENYEAWKREVGRVEGKEDEA
jgi:hypothetical protein